MRFAHIFLFNKAMPIMSHKSPSQLKYLAKIPVHITDIWKLEASRRKTKQAYDRAYAAWKKNVLKAHGEAIVMNAKFDKKKSNQYNKPYKKINKK